MIMIVFFVAVGVLLGVCRGGLIPEGVDYIGRFDSAKRAEWPGAGIRMSLLGSSKAQPVAVNITFGGCEDYCNFYVSAFLDCVQQQKFLITDENLSIHYTFPSSTHQIHEVSFVKITESNNGDVAGQMQIESVAVDNAVLSPIFKNQCGTTGKKLLFLGDSLTAAYGVDGASPCSFSAETEDVTHGYAFLVAQSLKADAHIVAWSGKGVVRNYGDPEQMSALPLPGYYNRTLATVSVSNSVSDANYWHPAQYPADVVVVMLGSNDYSTPPQPTDVEFTDGLVSFLRQIHVDYPQAKVLAMCASYTNWPSQCPNIQNATQLTDSAYLLLPPSVYNGGQGCDGHPNRISQQNMADVVLPAVQSLLV